MNLGKYLKKNNYNILLPLLAIVSFFTWYFKLDFETNIIIYVGIMILLTIMRQSVASLMLVVLFSIFATYSNEIHLLYQLLFIYVVIYFLITNFNHLTKTKGKLFWLLIPITTFSALSMIWSPTKADALAEFLVLVQGVVTYFVIVNDVEGDPIAPRHVAWVTSFLLLVLSAQYLVLTYTYFPNAPNKAHLSTLWLNPNLVAAALGLLWLPSLYKYYHYRSNKKIFLYLPLELLTIYSIYMSMSRGLYFGYIIGAVIILLLLLKIKLKKVTKVVFAILGFVMLFIFATPIIKHYNRGFYDIINDFSSSRLTMYQIAISRLRRPLTTLFGDGVGSAQYYLRLAGRANFYYHSSFLQIFTTRGIFSLILEVLLIYKVFKMLDNKTVYSKYVLVGFVIYLSHSIIDIGYLYQFLGIIYFLLIATVERNNLSNTSYYLDSKKPRYFI